MVSLGALCYLRLGDKDDEAAATARGGLAEAKKSTTRIQCHRVLGIVASRRGDAHTAEVEFLAGADEAREGGCYLLEVQCARDLLRFVLKEQGRESEAHALIEAAAVRMGTPPDEFEGLFGHQ